jgi:hypothetical protein
MGATIYGGIGGGVVLAASEGCPPGETQNLNVRADVQLEMQKPHVSRIAHNQGRHSSHYCRRSRW